MKKSIKLLLSLFVLLTLACQMNVHASNDYEYETLKDGTIKITGYLGNASKINIPEKINGKKVTALEYFAFTNYEITEINISRYITNISEGAFINCDNIKKINVVKENSKYSSVKGVLYDKNKTTLIFYPKALTQFSIEDSVTTLNENSICNGSFTSLTIPKKVKTIYSLAINCPSLSEIKVNKDNQYFKAYKGCLYNIDLTKLIKVPMCMDTLTMPDTLEIIGNEAAQYCNLISEVMFPNGLKDIGERAFNTCSSLEKVVFSDSIERIRMGAFACNEMITELVLPNHLTEVEWGAFSECINLKKVILPDTLEILGVYAFSQCEKLESIQLPKNLKTIKESTFESSGLKSIDIYENVSKIGEKAFLDCPHLKSINISEENQYYSSKNGVLMDKNQTLLIQAPTQITSFNMPNTVTKIDKYAFEDCVKLSDIKLSSTLKTIDDEAFYGCKKLKRLEIPASVISIGEYAFVSCRTLKSIVIPKNVSSIGKYAFSNNQLSSIEVEKGNKKYSSQNGALYNYNKTKLIKVPETKTSFTIINTTLTISSCAFSECQLKSIKIPNGVTTIESYAFENCIKLTSAEIPKSATNIQVDAFMNCENIVLKVYPKSKGLTYAKKYGIDYKTLKEVPITKVKLNVSKKTLNVGSTYTLKATITPSNTSDSKILSWSSSNKNIVTVNNGVIKAIKKGTATITVKTSNGKKTTCKVTVTSPNQKISITKTKISIKNPVYTGKAIKPVLTVKYGNQVLKNGTDYTLNYISKKNNKNPGLAYIMIKGKGKYNGSQTIKYYILPKTPSSLKIQAQKKKVQVSYKKVTGANGYEILYSTNKKKGFKKITTTKLNYTINKLTSQKTYYIKVRAYMNVSSKKYYSSYTSTKSIKVK